MSHQLPRKSFSIHGIDEKTEKAIGERAKIEGKSVNKIVKELIGKALGLGEKPPDNRAMFEDLCGVWSEADEQEFQASIADLETTDERDWR